MAAEPAAHRVDALLLLSFGGPERPEDVMPFLENVTRGRGIPPERLAEVAQHYLHFGGVSPINALNLDIIKAVEAEFAARGIELPVYFGNRNWHPMVEDTVERMRADGIGSALVFPTSAWGGYSGCLQYHEDIVRARAAVADAPELVKLRQYFDHPLFIGAFADNIRAAVAELPADKRDSARLVFTAHSIPVSADVASGPPTEQHLYSRQVAEAARLCAAATGFDDYDLVWQSRSGPPQIPWLDPDIVDHLDALAERGVESVVVCPVGFVSDHLEVIWDLDNEAKDRAAELGMAFARAATPGPDPRFAQLVADLVDEYRYAATPVRLSDMTPLGCTVNGAPCAVGCCALPPRRPEMARSTSEL
ncbi:ferrochelatase [Nocardia seriolae]|uniref:Coproporphyrin III ferrochelatase n=2 Tax=Nocardia seriolae TaxID=37332 RepID=A0ABC8AXI3_9NOCA|nr:ferrochelatase [Nocardia seriolae]APA98935.1 Protoporphyrin ferrochelatase [Nocardia seriolae]MTJ63990.1 ferrochelatase [Nocardia seriolae]MTJ71342.1 ferrochelatase [Nocardia seriolae]MTJ88551.1 ferrochelatase [Nocardia seriolae]MTK32535.1 ferrochelatase [Nocardia seriolae]